MTLADGDDFERHHGDWIRTNLPGYESLWSKYIGHDGRGSPLQLMRKLDAQSAQDRQVFCQSHYSACFSCFNLDEELERAKALFFKPQIAATIIQAKATFSNFSGHLGNALDMLARIDAKLGMKGNLCRRLDELYKIRNIVLHGPQIPFRINNGVMEIPELPGNWNDKAEWTSAFRGKFVPLVDFMEKLRNQVLQCFRDFHPAMEAKCAEIYSEGTIVLQQSPSSITGGTTLNVGFSGQSHL